MKFIILLFKNEKIGRCIKNGGFMARIKTKDLKNSYLFRVYDEEESKVFEKAIKMFANKFDSKSDMFGFAVVFFEIWFMDLRYRSR